MSAALAVVAPRVGQLIRMLGSDRDGEVVAAARALKRTLASAGADFHTLADTVERSAALAAAPVAHREYADHRSVAQWLLDNGGRLSQKERSFLANIASRPGTLSGRQSEWLEAIFERASAQSRRA